MAAKIILRKKSRQGIKWTISFLTVLVLWSGFLPAEGRGEEAISAKTFQHTKLPKDGGEYLKREHMCASEVFAAVDGEYYRMLIFFSAYYPTISKPSKYGPKIIASNDPAVSVEAVMLLDKADRVVGMVQSPPVAHAEYYEFKWKDGGRHPKNKYYGEDPLPVLHIYDDDGYFGVSYDFKGMDIGPFCDCSFTVDLSVEGTSRYGKGQVLRDASVWRLSFARK
ncbi:hypothetical protein KJ682_11540 [bacterium]|nr:hypothetical protein [bacterium]